MGDRLLILAAADKKQSLNKAFLSIECLAVVVVLAMLPHVQVVVGSYPAGARIFHENLAMYIFLSKS